MEAELNDSPLEEDSPALATTEEEFAALAKKLTLLRETGAEEDYVVQGLCLIEQGRGSQDISSTLCKLWRWLLGVAKAIVNGVLSVVKTVIDAALVVLTKLLSAVGSLASDIFSSPLLLLAGAALAFYLLSGSSEEEQST